MKREAIFSKDKKYRYFLKRSWDSTKPSCCYICINPSLADDKSDDNTVTRCIILSKGLGFGSIEMVNLFAFIDTNKTTFYDVDDPVGPENDKYILQSVKRCDKVIVAWGNEGSHLKRDEIVLKYLKPIVKSLYCLGNNKDGQPKHPGRISNVSTLTKFK
jgi:hypothetical protein